MCRTGSIQGLRPVRSQYSDSDTGYYPKEEMLLESEGLFLLGAGCSDPFAREKPSQDWFDPVRERSDYRIRVSPDPMPTAPRFLLQN